MLKNGIMVGPPTDDALLGSLLAPIFHARRLPRRFGSLNGLLTWDYGGLDRLVRLTATVTYELYANGARKTGLTWRFMGGCVWKHEESGLALCRSPVKRTEGAD